MTSFTTRSSSLRIRRARRRATARLVCFPHAGGTASFFRDWADAVPEALEVVAVQYPGREDRLAEPLVPTMDELSAQLADDLATLPGPLVFFGHSLGASVAYEVARRLARARPGQISHLLVSARPAPSLCGTTDDVRTDEQLWAELGQLGGTAELVLESAELRDLVLPALRNDFALADRYRWTGPEPLATPVVALVGDADPDVSPDQARAWDEVTTGPFTLRVLPGDHFYLVPRRREVLSIVTDLLDLRTHDWPSFP